MWWIKLRWAACDSAIRPSRIPDLVGHNAGILFAQQLFGR